MAGAPITLNETQLDLLNWISNDCPPREFTDYTHRIVARALERRGLVEIRGQGSAWSARITDAGKRLLAGADDSLPVRSSGPRILQLLAESDGPITLNESWTYAQADGVKGNSLKNRLRPRGRQLDYVLKRDEITWRFKPYDGDQFEVPAVPLPNDLRSAHPIAKTFMSRRAEVKDAVVASERRLRAALIVQALITECIKRGFQIEDGGWRRTFQATTKSTQYSFLVRDASGRHLQVQLYRVGWGGIPLKAVQDAKTVPVEAKLGLLFHAIDTAVAEMERAGREHRDREAAWEAKAAVIREAAARRLTESRRAKTLTSQLEQWELATRIRAFSAHLRASPRSSEELEWIVWMETYATQLDPSTDAIRMPAPEPFTKADLEPFMPRTKSTLEGLFGEGEHLRS